MRWDVRRHPDRDPGAAVDEKIRQLRGEDRRLLLRPVVVVDEVDGVLVDVGEHLAGDRGQPRFGVAHGGGRVAIDGAEVSLAVDQRIAHREVLREPDERVVQGLVAVRVVLPHHLADDRCALAIRAGGRQAHLAHREQDAAMDRLEPVADVGQGTGDDHAHGVVEVADPHLVLDADRTDVAEVVGHGRITPVGSGFESERRAGIRGAVRQGWPGRAVHRSAPRSRPHQTSREHPGACGSRPRPRGARRRSVRSASEARRG